jgi:2-amino-4-hydroxy-6-hydroxymethyldihydropteridine diphosphokinase
VGLGANLGDAPATLAAAVHALAALPSVELLGVSRLYRTRPVGMTDQPDFHNAVVALEVPAGPDAETGALALLIALKQIEAAFGRQKRKRWGPRELDLDLLLFGRSRIRVERPETAKSADPRKRAAEDGPQWLEVPHPQARERLFVLAPLSELAPRLSPPDWGESVRSARKKREAVEGAESVVPVARWNEGWREPA